MPVYGPEVNADDTRRVASSEDGVGNCKKTRGRLQSALNLKLALSEEEEDRRDACSEMEVGLKVIRRGARHKTVS